MMSTLVASYLEVLLSLKLYEGTEESRGNISQDNLYPIQDTSEISPELRYHVVILT
jgi:hypothetical protein